MRAAYCASAQVSALVLTSNPRECLGTLYLLGGRRLDDTCCVAWSDTSVVTFCTLNTIRQLG
jgi:hypothetical protein